MAVHHGSHAGHSLDGFNGRSVLNGLSQSGDIDRFALRQAVLIDGEKCKGQNRRSTDRQLKAGNSGA